MFSSNNVITWNISLPPIKVCTWNFEISYFNNCYMHAYKIAHRNLKKFKTATLIQALHYEVL